MKIKFIPLLFILIGWQMGFAQDNTLLTEKPGTFKITYGNLIGLGPDPYGKTCDYTKAESDAIKKNLVSLVDIFRTTPVLKDNKGFDGYCYLNIGRFNTKFGYGLPASPCFFFETWSLRKGKEVKHTIEPPQWGFEVNMMEKFCSDGFNVSDQSNSSTRTNPDFTEEATTKATVALRELFFSPGVKKQIAPGIDRYNDYIVIYNPERPPYWVQVTIREVYKRIMDYWKSQPDIRDKETMLANTEEQFSLFTEAEKDGFAYRGGKDIINKIGSEDNGLPVLIPNPDYWNRKLPRSAIQFMWMEIPPKEIVKSKMDNRFKRQDGYYYVSRLLYELDVTTLLPAIEK